MLEYDIVTKVLGVPIKIETITEHEQELNLGKLRIPNKGADIVVNQPILTVTKFGVNLEGIAVSVVTGTNVPMQCPNIIRGTISDRDFAKQKFIAKRFPFVTKEIKKTPHEKSMRRQDRRLASWGM